MDPCTGTKNRVPLKPPLLFIDGKQGTPYHGTGKARQGKSGYPRTAPHRAQHGKSTAPHSTGKTGHPRKGSQGYRQGTITARVRVRVEHKKTPAVAGDLSVALGSVLSLDEFFAPVADNEGLCI